MPILMGLVAIGLVAVIVAGALVVSGTGGVHATPSTSAVALAAPTSPPASQTAAPTATSTNLPTRAPLGMFTLTGSMTTPRDQATATLLRDGRVLIAGGSGPEGPAGVASAELFDPKTGVFSPTGSMNAPRRGGTATLLPDGRVLVSGIAKAKQVPGIDTSVDLYDPATGIFTPTGPIGTPRLYATATLLPNGRVLVAGGENDAGPLASAELYDPETGKFSPTGSMLTTGGGPAVLLRDGRVLVIGGWDASGKHLASAELYDPKTGKFSPTGSMVIAHSGDVSVATLLADGRVLVAGGSSGEPCGNGWCPGVATAEIYDPATGKFSSTGSMTERRWGCTATLLPDGRVLIAGGIATNSPLTSAETYDPTTGKFSSTASMSGGHSWANAILLPDGRVLIAGGGTAMAELYQP